MALACGGCALPLQWTLLSTAADGVSYASSGKTTGDHALSAALERDCSLMRVFDDEAICREGGAAAAGRYLPGLPRPKPAMAAAVAARRPG